MQSSLPHCWGEVRSAMTRGLFPLAAAVLAIAACGEDVEPEPEVTELPCDTRIDVPDGFCAILFHSGVGAARELVVAENGDVFVAIRDRSGQTGGVVALRDTDEDHDADTRESWGTAGGSGIALGDGVLYLATDNSVLRYPLPKGSLIPSGSPVTIVKDLPSDRNHARKSLALHPDGSIFVGIGSPSNACQIRPRTREGSGQDPCPELETRAGIWRFDGDKEEQTLSDGERFSTGIRNANALAIHPTTDELYAVVHGRDQLRELWPALYTAEEGSEKPSEEFVHVREDTDFGWPYCYHDPEDDRKLLAPEYGGDGETVGRCADKDTPEIGLPAHWAPNAIAFSTDDFHADYREGAFVAFHGSWNRTPVQEGYNVVWIPFDGDDPTGDWEVFADGFAGGQIGSPNDADNRPTGVAAGPEGALFVSESLRGKIWKIVEEEKE
jgi:glucose/arabinose dehydrogenase